MYPIPERNRSVINSSLLMARQDNMANSALNAIETIKTPLRPKESPKPPQMYPPIIIPKINYYLNISSVIINIL